MDYVCACVCVCVCVGVCVRVCVCACVRVYIGATNWSQFKMTIAGVNILLINELKWKEC